MKQFIELHLGSHEIVHGYDENNQEITERIEAKFTKKFVAIRRIQSLSEKYILIDYMQGRLVYWEYEEDYETVKRMLQQ